MSGGRGATLVVYRHRGGAATLLSAPFDKKVTPWPEGVTYGGKVWCSRSGLSQGGELKFTWDTEVREILPIGQAGYTRVVPGTCQVFHLDENTNGNGYDRGEVPVIAATATQGDDGVALCVQIGLFDQFDWTDFSRPKLIEKAVENRPATRLACGPPPAAYGMGQVAVIPIENGEGRTWTMESRLMGRVTTQVAKAIAPIAFATCVAGWEHPIPWGMGYELKWHHVVGDMMMTEEPITRDGMSHFENGFSVVRWDGVSHLTPSPYEWCVPTYKVGEYFFYEWPNTAHMVMGPNGQGGWSEFHWEYGFSDQEAIESLRSQARIRAEQSAQWEKEQAEKAKEEASVRREAAYEQADKERIERALSTKEGTIALFGSILLSLEDSKNAGNCAVGTAQWLEEQGLGGRTSVYLREIPKDAWEGRRDSRFIDTIKMVLMNKKSKKA